MKEKLKFLELNYLKNDWIPKNHENTNHKC